MSVVEAATEEQDISFLVSIDLDGGKLILTAGAPKVTGDDEERMLLGAAQDRRQPACNPDPDRSSPGRGIRRRYRTVVPPTYTVIGDAVNLRRV